MSRISEIKEREKTAVFGPWTAEDDPEGNIEIRSEEHHIGFIADVATAIFVTESRSDIPYLLGLIEKMENTLREVDSNGKFYLIKEALKELSE